MRLENSRAITSAPRLADLKRRVWALALAYVTCSLALAGAALFFVGGIGSRAEAATDRHQGEPGSTIYWQDRFEGRTFDSSGLSNSDGSGGANGLTGGTGASPWDTGSACGSDRITPSTSVVRAGTQSAQFTVLNSDVSPCTYTENPRAQLNYGAGTNGRFFEGDERWIAWSVYFPSAPTFTDHAGGDWTALTNIWGSPYGSTPATLSMVADDHPTLASDRIRVSFAESMQWSEVLQRDTWYDFTFHIKFSADSSVGYIEMWKNGQRVTFNDGSQTWQGQTLYSGSNGAVLQVPNYFRYGQTSQQTLYYDEVKVGTSYVAVQPGNTTAPSVSSVAPTDGATGVALTANAEATFSEAIDNNSISGGSTFTLIKQGTTTSVAATVTYDSTTKKATLNPDALLEAGSTYTATVKGGANGVKDAAGNPLAADKVWSFTTAAASPGDTIGVYYNGYWYLNNSNTNGQIDIRAHYGDSNYKPVVGDWDGDGDDTIGVYYNGYWYLNNSNTDGQVDIRAHYGDSNYIPVVGDWDGSTP